VVLWNIEETARNVFVKKTAVLRIAFYHQSRPGFQDGFQNNKYLYHVRKNLSSPPHWVPQQFRFQTGQTFIIWAGFKNPVKPKLFPPFSRFFPAGLKQNANTIA
jgi:hypothetical protein